MSLEVKIEERTVELAAALGVTSLKLNVKSTTGWPDRMFLIPGGRPFFIEFKQPGEEPEPRQRVVHAHLAYLQYDCETHDNAEEALTAIKVRLDSAIKGGWRHSADQAAAALEAARVSKESGKVPVGARGRRTIPRSRAG